MGHERALAPFRPALLCDLGAGSPFPSLGRGLTVLPRLWLAAWELPEKLGVLGGQGLVFP